MNLNPVGWASSSLRIVARLFNSGVNSTTPVTAISEAPIGVANADIALVAKGTGATLAQVPDGTATGGNKRGTGATDWQKNRNTAANVASGVEAVIAGGSVNTASGQQSVVGGGFSNSASGISSTIGGGATNTTVGSYATVAGGSTNSSGGVYATIGGGYNHIGNGNYSFIGGGHSNIASNTYSFVGGGQSNTAQTNTHATVCGGSTNTASGQYAFVGGGNTNTASGIYSGITGGSSNIAFGSNSFVGGGDNNRANGTSSCISGGANGTARLIVGYHVFPACSAPIATTQGCTQSALLLLARETTNATATVLTSNGGGGSTTNQVILPNNSAYSFSGEVIAGVTGAGDTARWTINGAIKRGANAASTAMVGTATVTMTHNDAGATAWTVAVTADTTNGGIAVTVTGAAATTIRWVCKINTTEMTY